MKKIALVLSGGAAKGYAHIGVIEVLEKNGIKPDLIVGTSMGSLVGGMYAAGKSIEEIKMLAYKFKSIGNFDLINTLFKGYLINTKKVEKLLKKELGDMLQEDCKIPFISISTQLNTGKECDFKTGVLRRNILASISVPGVFPNVEIDGNTYVDGGAVNNLGEDVVKKVLKDCVIISVDVLGNYENQVEKCKMKLVENMLNAMTLMLIRSIENKPKLADIRLVVSQPNVSQLDFRRKSAEKSINYGKMVAEKNIKKILKLVQGETNEIPKRSRKTNEKI